MATYLHPERSRSVGVDQRQEGGGEKDRKSGSNAVPNWVDGGGQQRGGERYTDHRTKLIIKAVFGEYCPACQKYLKDVEKEVTRLKHSNPKDAEFVRRVAQQIVEFLTLTDQLDVNMESFTKEKWNLHAGNMHSEFYKVFHETFRTDINWGRILMFVGFAVSFSVHLEEGTVPGAADSVLEWSCQIVEEDLGAFFVANKGWEGFSDYLETALRATQRSLLRHQEPPNVRDGQGESSLWKVAFASGVLAVGAVAAYTLKHSFSSP